MISDLLFKINKNFYKFNSNHNNDPDTNLILEQLKQVVFLMDSTGCIVYINPAWKNLTGYSIEETIGNQFLKYIHPKEFGIVEDYLNLILQSNNSEDKIINTRLIDKKDNSIHTILQANYLVDNESGTFKGIIGSLLEFTNEIQSYEMIEAEHRSLKNFLDNYSGLLYRCRNDENLSFEYASSGSFELTGYNKKQLIENDDINYINLTHPDDRQRIKDIIQRNLQDRKSFELSHRIINSSGDPYWIFNKGKGNFSSSGELLSIEGTIFNFNKQHNLDTQSQNNPLYDTKTGLLNKLLFLNRLEHSVEKSNYTNNYTYTFIYLYFDQYSQILANLGKENIDIVITKITNRITKILNRSASLCRLQEDNLGILIDTPSNTIKTITKITNQIQEQIQAPITIEENEVYITASMGIVIGNNKFKTIESVLTEAQNALNRALALGGARYEVSDLVTHGKAYLQTHMENELELALKNNSFLVHWQPIVNIHDRNLIGLEARLAWPHPIKGIIYADQFVPSAEETQLITPLWEWMLNDTCRQLTNWKTKISNVNNAKINIQISGATLLDADSIIRLREKLISAKPNFCNLVMGVSENVLDDAPNTTKHLLNPIKGKDIQLLLDCYGKNKTSLSIFDNMSIDLLRLDRKFLQGSPIDDIEFISAIVSFAHQLNIDVIADNIKSKEQLSILKNANVDYVQGEYISESLNEFEIIKMLSNLTNFSN